MNPEQYAVLQAAITAKIVQYVGGLGRLFVPAGLSPRDWLGFLELLWPAVKQARDESAALGRTFYDQQRDLFHPEVPNLARELEPYEFQWFVQDMEPARKVMSVEQSKPQALEVVKLQVARAVENGGRRQIIHAVQADVQLDDEPEPPDPPPTDKLRKPDGQLSVDELEKMFDEMEAENERLTRKPVSNAGKAVRGWARVATGAETCAWCLTLVSRGPVYESAFSAGLQVPDYEAVELALNDPEITAQMNQWHPGCDCKVVPVFKATAWVGQDAAKRALDLYIEASKRAYSELQDSPDKKYYSMKERRWVPTTKNRETINQLRQMIDSGEIKSSDWAALQVA